MARTPESPRTLLIMGNGLTLSLLEYAGARMSSWNTSKPLSWEIINEPTGQTLEECLPSFYAEVAALRGQYARWSDFQIIDQIVRVANVGRSEEDRAASFAAARLDAEVRHFLALAYSHFQREADNIDRHGWSWRQYMLSIADTIGLAISFNYELVGEQLLVESGIPLFHIGIEADMADGVPIGKPHGSIDYRMIDRVIVGMPSEYPLRNALALMNTPMERLTHDELLDPRLHVEVVPPLQASAIRDFQWVTPIFDVVQQYGHIFERVIIVGLSCWPVDQPEICEILASLSPTAEVIIANPDAKAMILFNFHAQRLGLRPVTHWK